MDLTRYWRLNKIYVRRNKISDDNIFSKGYLSHFRPLYTVTRFVLCHDTRMLRSRCVSDTLARDFDICASDSLFFFNLAETQERCHSREGTTTSLREYEKLEMPAKTRSAYSHAVTSQLCPFCARVTRITMLEWLNARLPKRIRTHTRAVPGTRHRHVCLRLSTRECSSSKSALWRETRTDRHPMRNVFLFNRRVQRLLRERYSLMRQGNPVETNFSLWRNKENQSISSVN